MFSYYSTHLSSIQEQKKHMITTNVKKKKEKWHFSAQHPRFSHVPAMQDSEVTHSFSQPIVYENIALSRVPASES